METVDDTVKNWYSIRSIKEYEASHGKRFDGLVKDLELDKIENSYICDFGCGYCPIFRRMHKGKHNSFLGIDGYRPNREQHQEISELPVAYFQRNLDRDEYLFPIWKGKLDYAFSFETIEHLQNPYHYLREIKTYLKLGGILYLTIPEISTTHNTLYPGLFYPVDNFKIFLGQMAFKIERHVRHREAFSQEVFTLRNMPWSESKLMFPKSESKFQGVEPLVAINL